MVDESRDWPERSREAGGLRGDDMTRYSHAGLAPEPSVYPERPGGPPYMGPERGPSSPLDSHRGGMGYRGGESVSTREESGMGRGGSSGSSIVSSVKGNNLLMITAGIIGAVGVLFLLSWFIVSLRDQFGYPGSLLVVGLILLGIAAVVMVLQRARNASPGPSGNRGGHRGRRSY